MALDLARHMSQRDWSRARKLFEGGASAADIGRRFSVKDSTISYVARRDNWTKATALNGEPEPASDAALDAQGSTASGSRMRLPDLSREQADAVRRNLVTARVTSGFSQLEAAARLGYENSTQLSLIESGRRPVPSAATFIIKAAEVYGVSIDWLVGASPLVEPDGKLVREHAILRQFESIAHGVGATLAAALVETSAQAWPLLCECQKLLDLVDRAGAALQTMRNCYGFDDARGGSSLLRAHEEMAEAARPLRSKLNRFRSTEQILVNLKAGRSILPEHFDSPDAESELDARQRDEVERAIRGTSLSARSRCRLA